MAMGLGPGTHGALIDLDLFAQAQRAREANTRRPLRLTPEASPWALSGVATCSCGASMRAYGRSDGKRRVQCVGRTERGACDEPTFFAQIVEDQIGGLLRRFSFPPSDQPSLHGLAALAESLGRRGRRAHAVYAQARPSEAALPRGGHRRTGVSRAQSRVARGAGRASRRQGNPDEATGSSAGRVPQRRGQRLAGGDAGRAQQDRARGLCRGHRGE